MIPGSSTIYSMEQRDVKTMVILATAIAVVGVLFVVFRLRSSDEPPSPALVPGAPPPRTLTQSGALARTGDLAPVVLPAPKAATAVRQVSIAFAERYGSFSSEGDFVNIEDLYPLMTERFRTDRTAFVASQRALVRDAVFRATTSIVTSVDVTFPDSTDAATAQATVTTQRTEVERGGTVRSYAQALTLDCVRLGDGWLVDSATWIPRN